MVPHPVGVRFYQRRSLAFPGALQRLLGRDVERQDVVAIDLYPGEPVGHRLLGDGLRGGLSLPGTEMAHWLFWQMKTFGVRITPAKLSPSWKSPSDVPPSPKKHTTAVSSFLSLAA